MAGAITSDRPYRAAMRPQEAFDIIRAEVDEGKLDDHVVTTFRYLIPAWEHRRRNDPALQGFRLQGAQMTEAA